VNTAPAVAHVRGAIGESTPQFIWRAQTRYMNPGGSQRSRRQPMPAFALLVDALRYRDPQRTRSKR